MDFQFSISKFEETMHQKFMNAWARLRLPRRWARRDCIQLGNEKREALKDDETKEAVTSFINGFPLPSSKPSSYRVIKENNCTIIDYTESKEDEEEVAKRPMKTAAPVEIETIDQMKLDFEFDLPHPWQCMVSHK